MNYKLLFVGKKLYPEKVFIEEAQKYGVNRALPLRIIKSLKWGDKVLLATFKPKIIEEKDKNLDGRKNRKGGKANVFGYVTVTGLNVVAEEAFKSALNSQLEIVKSTTPSVKITRQCGTYLIRQAHTVKDSIKSIVEKAITLAYERFPEKVKFFITGYFTNLDLVLEPVNFTRVLQNVKLDLNITQKNSVKENSLGYIDDYEKRTYVKRYSKRGRPKKEK